MLSVMSLRRQRNRPSKVLCLACLPVLVAGGPPPPIPSGPVKPFGADSPSWSLRFADEFDGTTLDADKWRSGFGWGPTSDNTVGFCDPDNNIVGGGALIQRVERRSQRGRPFSVGCINGRDRFRQLYGFWEARIRTVGCRGSRAAFWAKPNDESWPPELDVVEVYGDDRQEAELTVHWEKDGEHLEHKGRYRGPDFSADFHIFGAEWKPDEVIWYIDGVERFRTRRGAYMMNDGGPFYTMIEAQVVRASSSCGRWPYYSQQYIDYVRIWEKED